MSEVLDFYWAIPPMTRTVLTVIAIQSWGCHLFGIFSPHWFYYDTKLLLKFLPEIWRPFTSFSLSGGGLGCLMDPYFVYQYMTQLETANPRLPRMEDVLWYLLTVGSMIIALNHYFTGFAFFLPALTVALCYTATQDQRGQKGHFLFFSVPAQSLPYCMIIMSLFTSPGMIPLQITGIVAAHMHDFLSRIYPEFGKGPNLLPTPGFLSRIVQTPRTLKRAYGTAIRPNVAAEPSTGRTTGASGPVLPESWKSRGSGHRLGGD